jgi:3-oxoacyl-ACP reductase-like protein
MQATLNFAEVARKRILLEAVMPELLRKADDLNMELFLAGVDRVADASSDLVADSSGCNGSSSADQAGSSSADQAGSSSAAAVARSDAAKANTELLMTQLQALFSSMCADLALTDHKVLLKALHVSNSA